VSALDTLEQQLRESARRRRGRVRLGPGETPRRGAERRPVGVARRGRGRAVAAAGLLALGGVFLLVRDPAPPDEREAAVPTPAATWTPVLGDDDRGHPSISRSPVPAEQAAAYAVLRRPQNAADRSEPVRMLLARLSPSMVRGVRVDAVRRLDRRGGRTVILVSAELLRMNPRDPGDDIKDGLCMFTGHDGGTSGGTCASFRDARSGRMRATLPPRGLAPDGTTRVTVRVRGGRTLTIVPRDNYYDASWIGEGAAAGIARPRFIR
jgi:hypothetical protein